MSTAVPQAAQSSTSRHARLWVRELPFSLVLILTVLGVAYTSFSKRPIIGYWEILEPAFMFFPGKSVSLSLKCLR
jgi:hypothetical protein